MNPDEMEQMRRGSEKAKEYAEQTGQKHEDMLFSLGGEEVQSIQELNAAGGVMPFVCMPTSYGPAPIPNCHIMWCDGCRTAVHMSPATKETFDKVEKKLVICMDCLSKQIKEAEAKKNAATND